MSSLQGSMSGGVSLHETAIFDSLKNKFGGNSVVINTLIALMIPVAIGGVTGAVKDLWNMLRRQLARVWLIASTIRRCRRVIEHKEPVEKEDSEFRKVTSGKAGEQTIVLIKAILYYTHEHPMMPNPELSQSVMRDAKVRLLDTPYSKTAKSDNTGEAKGPSKFMMDKSPMDRESPVEVSPGILMLKDEGEHDENEHKREVAAKMMYHTEIELYTMVPWCSIFSRASAGETLIDGFLQKCLDEYLQAERDSTQDKTRFLYEPVVSNEPMPSDRGRGPPGGSVRLNYKKYKLSDDAVTFDTIFFDKKNELLSQVEDFMAKKGKYARRGVPHRLGLLLHGPPGTGKTSIIKALATHTGRHVVNIRLNCVKTNSELMDIFYRGKFPTLDDGGGGDEEDFNPYSRRGRPSSVGKDSSIPLDKVIFVMEEIDTAGNITKQRKPEDDDDEEEELVVSEVRMTSDGAAGESAELDQNGIIMKPEKKKKKSVPPQGDDRLNLGGVLEVLDGVVDCPGRILIMTTNHPDKLDEALVRPGRVNNRLHLSYMSFDSAKQMLESLTFDSESDEQQLSAPACALLNEFFESGLRQLGFGPGSDDGELKTYKPKVTPAELLQLWQWNDSLATDSSIVQTILDILKGTINDKGSVVEDIRNRAKRDRGEEEPHATNETPRSLSRAVSKALIRVASNRSNGTQDLPRSDSRP